MGVAIDSIVALGKAHGRTEVFGERGSFAHVVVAWAATVELLQAIDEPTIIVCRAHPFFMSPSLVAPDQFFDEHLWPDRSAGDPVIAAKRTLLKNRASAIVWAPSLWNAGGSATRSAALAREAGLTPVALSGNASVVVEAPAGEFSDQLGVLLALWGASRALVTGTRDREVRRIGIIAGVASPSELEELLQYRDVGLVIVGETIEWEGTPFMQDQQWAKIDVPLVAIGSMLSEQPANRDVVEILMSCQFDAEIHEQRLQDAAWIPEVAR